ncbi:RNA 2',3'-cyclic phosphodiesterase [Austwickia sp. TVS 96-490-7B]|uniref:RNA 2',3'-cyclic phosphodiesterase n=1 Tax=Austwickia sp. TVS 96-490-7B TaxID=2830843 RepID=UPI001C570CAC|nr:RNA 2',3'-cyclic phosphodiesterase [Austwickia sp. TVS 96-490-7B]
MSSLRVFAAVVPPLEVVEDLEDFLAVRRDAAPAEWRWTVPDQWHVTCAFAAEVPDFLLDDIGERLADAAGRSILPSLRVTGGGAFPDPDRARVWWAGVVGAEGGLGGAAEELAALSRRCRTAFATSGVRVDGQRFRAHLTLARLSRPLSVARWVRLLDGYHGPSWQPKQVSLIVSYLGQGPGRRPRYEVWGTYPVG